jgi:hypothetical protein
MISADLRDSHSSVPRTGVLGYFQPSLRDWTVRFGILTFSDETAWGGYRDVTLRSLLGGLLAIGLIVQCVNNLAWFGVAQNDPRLVFDGVRV